MHLGPLNRNGVIWSNNPTKGPGGAVKPALTLLKRVPITVGDIEAHAQLTAGRVAEQVDGAFTTRWLSTVKTGDVLEFEGTRGRIAKIKQLGRREGLVLYVEAIK